MGKRKGSGKILECLECFCCKTRVFEKVSDLMSWCCRRSIKPNATWVKEIEDLSRVRLIWCEKQTDQYCSHGFSPRNASPRHMTDIETILKKERHEVVISSQNKCPFISGAWDTCPLKSI